MNEFLMVITFEPFSTRFSPKSSGNAAINTPASAEYVCVQMCVLTVLQVYIYDFLHVIGDKRHTFIVILIDGN